MLGNLQKQGIPISFAFYPNRLGSASRKVCLFIPRNRICWPLCRRGQYAACCRGGHYPRDLSRHGIGVARLSRNWLLTRLATLYVETFRNVPLLLWLVFHLRRDSRHLTASA